MKPYINLVDYNKKLKLDLIVNDIDAYQLNYKYRIIYNKLWLAESQDLNAAPMGILPNEYPIVIKPIINLFGMSKGFKIINNEKEYLLNQKDGFFWEKYLNGNHYTIDIILKDNKIKFVGGYQSFADKNGSFNYHESINYELPIEIVLWINKHLKDYHGLLNLEIIKDDNFNYIIEGHLRLNGDFQIYNDIFVKEIDELLRNKRDKINYIIPKRYLIPVFVNKNLEINKEKIFRLIENFNKKYQNINSYHFDTNKENQSEYLNRILIYDVNDLKLGLKLRKLILKLIYGST